MAWNAIDRTKAGDLGPGLSESAKKKIRSFFPRYPDKQAATLPALHIAQDALGYISLQAIRDIAEVTEQPPSKVMDVVTFYTHYWTHPRGKKVILRVPLADLRIDGRPAIDRRA